MYKSITSVAFMASLLPSTLAARCAAVGHLDSNTIGFGGGVSQNSGITIFRNDEFLLEWTPGDSGPPVCSDIINIIVDQLDQTVGWGASCGPLNFGECHGAYGEQTHIDGEEVQNGNDFYGVGITSTSQCRIEFDCEDP